MKSHVPKTDSIRELAEFWDTHDFTDSEDQFEEVTEPLFRREPVIGIAFASNRAEESGDA
jgi:hypothetical protein